MRPITMTRRSFLKLVGVSSAGFAALGMGPLQHPAKAEAAADKPKQGAAACR